MELDEVLKKHVGQFGRFQVLVVLVLSMDSTFTAFHMLAPVFLVGKAEHHCDISDFHQMNCTSEQLLEFSIPQRMDGQYSSCQMYDTNYSALNDQNICKTYVNVSSSSAPYLPETRNLTKKQCSSWVYDRSLYQSTMVTEWNLVCGREYLASSVAAVFMIGWMVGCSLFGMLADWLGRRPVVLGVGAAYILNGVITALVPNISVVLVLRFLQGCGTAAKTTIVYNMMLEFIGPQKRTLATYISCLYWAAGFVIMAGLAYLLRTWRMLQLAITVPEILFLILVFVLIPESPRWLLVKNRKKTADAVLHKMAVWNKTNYPENICIKETVKKTGTLWDLLHTTAIRKTTLNLWLAWFTNGFVYYGLALNTSNLAGNPYLNFLIAGAVEVPAYSIFFLLVNKIGRVRLHVTCMLVIGICLIAVLAVPAELDWLVSGIFMVGKLFISMSFSMIVFYTSEIYPTEIRVTGYATSCMVSRIGSLLAAYVGLLEKVHSALPLVVFGICAVVSGLCGLAFVETKGAPLLQTVAQAEEFIQQNACRICKCFTTGKDNPKVVPDGKATSVSLLEGETTVALSSIGHKTAV